MKKGILLLLSMLFTLSLSAQIDLNKIKNKVKDKVKEEAPDIIKEQIMKQLSKSRENYNSTDFNYAVSYGDNSSPYENKETLKALKKVSLFLMDPKKVEDIPARQRAQDMNDLGEMLYTSGKYKSAEMSFNRSLTLLNQHGYSKSGEASLVTSNLGLLYHSTGRYAKAEEFYTKALKMRLQTTEKIGITASYNNLGVLYKDMGFFTKAEKNMNNALESVKNHEGQNSVNHAIILNNIAMLYQQMGKYEDAEKQLKKSIKMADKHLRKKSAAFVRLKVNLALLYQLQERYTEAEKIYLEALDIKKRRMGTKHPDYAQLLRNLASLYQVMGKTDKVEKLLLTAKDINKKKLGEEHPSYAGTLYDLAVFYHVSGNLDKAKALYKSALEIQETKLGKHHPSFINTLENTAVLYWQKKDYKAATKNYHQALDEYIYQINTYFPAMNEYEKSKFWAKIHPKFLRFYSYVYDAYENDNNLNAYLYNYHIATKALLLSSSRKVKNRILNSNDNNLINKYSHWIDLKSYIGKLYTYSKDELKEEDINLDSLERVSRQLEKELSKLSSDFAKSTTEQQLTYAEIAQNLKSGEAAIEFIRIQKYNHLIQSNEVVYAALVLKNNRTVPELVFFDNGNEMESELVKKYSKAIHSGKNMTEYYTAYWGKLNELTKNYNDLYISLDGIYNQVNLNTLQAPNGKYILEKKNIRYLTNTKDVIKIAGKKINKYSLKGKSAYLIGSPDYLMDLSSEYAYLTPLPGTKKEVNNIIAVLKKNSWRVTSFFEKNATEENVKKVNSPYVLHIATHGFFLEDIYSSMNTVFGIEPERAEENPLLRSGLMLAGADKTVMEIDTKENRGKDDGVLNAFEAMILNLENTELVVLSACQTGLGEIKSGEGVYGLQRAFQIAGSSSVLLSLWEVSDEGTQDLMSAFYRNWLKSGDKYEAFHKAQLQMKEKYKFPYFWGAFIMVNQ